MGELEYKWEGENWEHGTSAKPPFVYIESVDDSTELLIIAEIMIVGYGTFEDRFKKNIIPDDMARRIAACLNFFEGIPIEAIEVLVKHRVVMSYILKGKEAGQMKVLVSDGIQEV